MINDSSLHSAAYSRFQPRFLDRVFLSRTALFLLPTCAILLTQSVVAQRVESTKDKVISMRGVEFKKDLGRAVDGNWVYQITMENKTNEAMVVELALDFANDDISESFEENYRLEPGETKVGS